jgi:hypothetical protein
VIAAAALSIAVAPVAGYVGGPQPPYLIRLRAPHDAVSCKETVTITATVRDTLTGERAASVSVNWGIHSSPSAEDRLSHRLTATNARGRTSVTVSFGPKAGNRTIYVFVLPNFPNAVTVRCTR